MMDIKTVTRHVYVEGSETLHFFKFSMPSVCLSIMIATVRIVNNSFKRW